MEPREDLFLLPGPHSDRFKGERSRYSYRVMVASCNDGPEWLISWSVCHLTEGTVKMAITRITA